MTAPEATNEQMDEMATVFNFCVHLASDKTGASIPSVLQSFLFLSFFVLSRFDEKAALAVLDAARKSMIERSSEEDISDMLQEPMSVLFAAFTIKTAGEVLQ